MGHYPTTFAETLTPITAESLQDQAGQEAIRALGTMGFEVSIGLRREDVPEVTTIANQQGVREFCPKDATTRFGDEPMAEEWHKKERVFFQLRRKIGETTLVGYGWTGPEQSEELPDCENTFAVRLSEEIAGQGVGALFTTAIVSGSMALGMRKIGLETWKSNIGAWKSYERAGAQQACEIPGKRMSIIKDGRRTRRRQIDDIRRFMFFAQTFAE